MVIVSCSSLAPTYPEKESSSCKDIVCFLNGSVEPCLLPKLSRKLIESIGTILVDGGTSHYLSCKEAIALPPLLYLIGDLDSIDSTQLDAIQCCSSKPKIYRLPRDKDITDFEASLLLLKLHAIRSVYVIAGLGKRLDHSLSNLYTIVKDSLKCKVSLLCNRGEQIIAVSSESPLILEDVKGYFLSIFPVCGEYSIKVLHGLKPLNQGYTCTDSKIDLHLDSGRVICIIQQQEPENKNTDGIEAIRHEFYQNIASDFQLLTYCCIHPYPFQIRTDYETVFCLTGAQQVKFSTEIGQTISLIPFNGSASGVTTNGLHWELNDSILNTDFFSLSNVAVKKDVSISIRSGSIICSVNHFVDSNMIEILSVKK